MYCWPPEIHWQNQPCSKDILLHSQCVVMDQIVIVIESRKAQSRLKTMTRVQGHSIECCATLEYSSGRYGMHVNRWWQWHSCMRLWVRKPIILEFVRCCITIPFRLSSPAFLMGSDIETKFAFGRAFVHLTAFNLCKMTRLGPTILRCLTSVHL